MSLVPLPKEGQLLSHPTSRSLFLPCFRGGVQRTEGYLAEEQFYVMPCRPQLASVIKGKTAIQTHFFPMNKTITTNHNVQCFPIPLQCVSIDYIWLYGRCGSLNRSLSVRHLKPRQYQQLLYLQFHHFYEM